MDIASRQLALSLFLSLFLSLKALYKRCSWPEAYFYAKQVD